MSPASWGPEPYRPPGRHFDLLIAFTLLAALALAALVLVRLVTAEPPGPVDYLQLDIERLPEPVRLT